MYSNKYISISTIQISETENSSMKVSVSMTLIISCTTTYIINQLFNPSQIKLIPHDSEHCLFRILPRYKFRSTGDEVATYSCII